MDFTIEASSDSGYTPDNKPHWMDTSEEVSPFARDDLGLVLIIQESDLSHAMSNPGGGTITFTNYQNLEPFIEVIDVTLFNIPDGATIYAVSEGNEFSFDVIGSLAKL